MFQLEFGIGKYQQPLETLCVYTIKKFSRNFESQNGSIFKKLQTPNVEVVSYKESAGISGCRIAEGQDL